MTVRDFIIDLIIISQSSFLLWHFSNIWRHGEYLVGEPNIIIRSLETALLLAIFAFGVTKYISDLRRGMKRKRDGS